MEERNLVVMDIGTSKIALMIAKVEDDSIQIIYYRETPSGGIRHSRVMNPNRASVAIRDAIRKAEEETGIRITQVIVGLPKYKIRQVKATNEIPRDPEVFITEEEIDNIKSMALNDYPLENPESEILFGAVAQSFSDGIDFQIVENDVIGMAPDRLDSLFALFIGQRKYVKDLRLAFHKAGDICVSREYFTPDAIAKAVLYDSETENGVALIDLGAGVTSVSIYYGNIMRYYASLPFGAKTITSDIMRECLISEDLAENIKLAYGACMPEKLQTLSEKVLIIQSDKAVASKQVPVKYLSEIITARVKEIIEGILYEIQESGFADSIRSGIVITGGGANLLNMANLIKDMSGYSVRAGHPKRLFTVSDESMYDVLYDTAAATCIGMILMARNENINCSVPKDENADGDRTNGVQEEPETIITGPALDENGKGNLFGFEEPEPAPRKKGRWKDIIVGNVKKFYNDLNDENV